MLAKFRQPDEMMKRVGDEMMKWWNFVDEEKRVVAGEMMKWWNFVDEEKRVVAGEMMKWWNFVMKKRGWLLAKWWRLRGARKSWAKFSLLATPRVVYRALRSVCTAILYFKIKFPKLIFDDFKIVIKIEKSRILLFFSGQKITVLADGLTRLHLCHVWQPP